MPILEENEEGKALLPPPPSAPPVPPLPPHPPPSTSVVQGNQNQTGIMYRVQDGFTRFREKCQSTWRSLIDLDVVKEEDELETIEEKELAMDEVSLRPKPGVMSKEWTNRLTDYQFLSGKDEVLPKRQTRFSIRSRRNQRASVMVPQVTRKPSDPGYRCSKCQMVVHRCCLNGVQRCEGRPHQELPVPLPQAPIEPPLQYPGYGTLQLLKYPWWVESMTRPEANLKLKKEREGTFLIRWSDRHQKLVLSLKVAHDVKHMRVLKHEEGTSFYLSEVRHFRTIERLVNYYRQNSLSECFSDLFSVLSHPVYETAVVRYPYQGVGANYLSLEPRDRVIIISHDGESTGWWKGRIENRVGYFPKEFVQLENNLDIV